RSDGKERWQGAMARSDGLWPSRFNVPRRPEAIAPWRGPSANLERLFQNEDGRNDDQQIGRQPRWEKNRRDAGDDAEQFHLAQFHLGGEQTIVVDPDWRLVGPNANAQGMLERPM